MSPDTAACPLGGRISPDPGPLVCVRKLLAFPAPPPLDKNLRIKMGILFPHWECTWFMFEVNSFLVQRNEIPLAPKSYVQRESGQMNKRGEGLCVGSPRPAPQGPAPHGSQGAWLLPVRVLSLGPGAQLCRPELITARGQNTESLIF